MVDPSGTVGALRGLGVPLPGAVVRALAVCELVFGGIALATTSVGIVLLVGSSYGTFAVVVAVALARRVPIDSCGCLGGIETPPSWSHLVVIGVAIAGAVGEALDPSPALVERVTGDGAGGVAYAAGACALAVLAVLALRAGRRPIGDGSPTLPR